jgi:hypothetical protein
MSFAKHAKVSFDKHASLFGLFKFLKVALMHAGKCKCRIVPGKMASALKDVSNDFAIMTAVATTQLTTNYENLEMFLVLVPQIYCTFPLTYISCPYIYMLYLQTQSYYF